MDLNTRRQRRLESTELGGGRTSMRQKFSSWCSSFPKSRISSSRFSCLTIYRTLFPLLLQIIAFSAAVVAAVAAVLPLTKEGGPTWRAALNSAAIFFFAILVFVADIVCLSTFGYIRLIYTAIGRALIYIHIGILIFDEDSIQATLAGFIIVVGIIYGFAAILMGGVPLPLLNRNNPNTELILCYGDISFIKQIGDGDFRDSQRQRHQHQQQQQPVGVAVQPESVGRIFA